MPSYFLGQPWYGDEANPTAKSFQRSGARLVIVHRTAPVVAELERDAYWRDLDSLLFPSAEEASRFPLKVYQAASE